MSPTTMPGREQGREAACSLRSVAPPAAIGGIWGGFSSRIAQDDAMQIAKSREDALHMAKHRENVEVRRWQLAVPAH